MATLEVPAPQLVPARLIEAVRDRIEEKLAGIRMRYQPEAIPGAKIKQVYRAFPIDNWPIEMDDAGKAFASQIADDLCGQLAVHARRLVKGDELVSWDGEIPGSGVYAGDRAAGQMISVRALVFLQPYSQKLILRCDVIFRLRTIPLKVVTRADLSNGR